MISFLNLGPDCIKIIASYVTRDVDRYRILTISKRYCNLRFNFQFHGYYSAYLHEILPWKVNCVTADIRHMKKVDCNIKKLKLESLHTSNMTNGYSSFTLYPNISNVLKSNEYNIETIIVVSSRTNYVDFYGNTIPYGVKSFYFSPCHDKLNTEKSSSEKFFPMSLKNLGLNLQNISFTGIAISVVSQIPNTIKYNIEHLFITIDSCIDISGLNELIKNFPNVKQLTIEGTNLKGFTEDFLVLPPNLEILKITPTLYVRNYPKSLKLFCYCSFVPKNIVPWFKERKINKKDIRIETEF